MSYLKKEDTLLMRDEKGEIIPQEITLENLPDNPKAKVRPLTSGQLASLSSRTNNGETDLDLDAELISKHYADPSYTEEEAKHIKAGVRAQMMLALMAISLDTSQDEVGEKSGIGPDIAFPEGNE